MRNPRPPDPPPLSPRPAVSSRASPRVGRIAASNVVPVIASRAHGFPCRRPTGALGRSPVALQ